MIDMRVTVQTAPNTLTARGDVSRRFKTRGDIERALVAAVFLGSSPPVDPPINTFAPQVSGYVVPAFDLTYTPGIWDNATSITPQWRRNGVAIPGETGATYTPVQADVGQLIDVLETATGPGGSETASSNTALDTLAGFASDPTHVDIFGAIPETLSPLSSGAYGIVSGQSVQRMTGLIYGAAGPVLSEGVTAQQPIYQVVGGVPEVRYDGGNDRSVHQGTGLASRLSVNWACEMSVTALRNSAVQPLWGTALTTDVTLYQRVCSIAGSGTTPGASNVRNSIRDSTGSISTCIMVSSRAAVGAVWALRLSMRRTPTDQTITEVQPDTGTQTSAVGSVPSQDRFAFGAFATPTSVSGFANMSLHACAFWDAGTPSALSVAAARALFTFWNMP